MTEEKVHYLTQDGFETLQKELVFLKDVKIPEIASKIDEAKQQGDLSENAEYHEAKDEMAWTQARSYEVQYILDHAKIMDGEEKNEGIIKVGRSATVRIGEKTKTYTIVGPQEADPVQGRISNESPLGESFLGRKTGDKIEVRTPAGVQIYEIIDIK